MVMVLLLFFFTWNKFVIADSKAFILIVDFYFFQKNELLLCVYVCDNILGRSERVALADLIKTSSSSNMSKNTSTYAV